MSIRRVWTKVPTLIVAALVVLLFLAAGCRRQQEEAPAAKAKAEGAVQASAAYLEHFGSPPTPAEGSCYAFVGYYPDAEDGERIRPFPLFIFDRQHQEQIVAELLLRWGEGWDLGGLMRNPFPPGVELLSLERQGDMVRIELTGNVLDQTRRTTQKVILDMFTETMTQFEGIDRVMLVGAGRLFPVQAERGFLPDPSVVTGPGAPSALALTGTWEGEGSGPKEVAVLFDRPVEVDSLALYDDRGRELEGEYFRTMFDMAVVVHPADGADIRGGQRFRVVWSATDALGRSATGDDRLPLKKILRPGHG